MKNLLNLVNTLSDQIPDLDRMASTVSRANVGWHIEHSCLVIIKITETVGESNPDQYQWKWNVKRFFIFLLRKIPRGRAQAPNSVMPVDQITKEHLTQTIVQAKKAISTLSNCAKNQYFTHPFFDQLNLKSTQKFLAIHTYHHLKIINDILAH